MNGSLKFRLPANLNFSLKGVNAEILISKLKKTVISSGSACTSSDLDPSYVLTGMGLNENIVRSSMRIGMGRFTTKQEVRIAADEIIKVSEEIKKNA